MAVTLEDVLFEKVWNVVLNTGNEDGKRKNESKLHTVTYCNKWRRRCSVNQEMFGCECLECQ